jgi:hypothetical protein
MENLKAQLPMHDELGGTSRNSCSTQAETTGPKARRTYFLSRDSCNGRLRSCWLSPDKNLYCGICLRGAVSGEVGSVCASCGSCVERLVEVLDGGKPYRLAAREKKPPAATERIGKVVILNASA